MDHSFYRRALRRLRELRVNVRGEIDWKTADHSALSAATGSIRVARRAGA
jgi:hypothetical protein